MYSSQHHIYISIYRGERNLFTSYPEPIVINEFHAKIWTPSFVHRVDVPKKSSYEQRGLLSQSTYKCRVEKGEVYMPSQLERTPQLYM